MIFLDTETTGLLNASASKLELQPHITEICMIKTNDDLKEIESLEVLVKPPIPISEEITRITGITDEILKDAPPFVKVYNRLVDFTLGERTIVAHNATFDMGMLYVELARIGKEFHYPWPPNWVCTVEKSMPLENKRLRLKYLHQLATGHEHKSQHRARPDVEALITCFGYLRERNLLV